MASTMLKQDFPEVLIERAINQIPANQMRKSSGRLCTDRNYYRIVPIKRRHELAQNDTQPAKTKSLALSARCAQRLIKGVHS